MRHVLFRSRGRRYALPLSAVREVVPAPTEWTQVPLAPPCALGVFNLRGRVVLAVELEGVLEPGAPRGPSQRILLLEQGRRDLGLAVEGVDGIEAVEAWGPPPEGAHRACSGASFLHEREILLLGLDALEHAIESAFSP